MFIFYLQQYRRRQCQCLSNICCACPCRSIHPPPPSRRPRYKHCRMAFSFFATQEGVEMCKALLVLHIGNYAHVSLVICLVSRNRSSYHLLWSRVMYCILSHTTRITVMTRSNFSLRIILVSFNAELSPVFNHCSSFKSSLSICDSNLSKICLYSRNSTFTKCDFPIDLPSHSFDSPSPNCTRWLM